MIDDVEIVGIFLKRIFFDKKDYKCFDSCKDDDYKIKPLCIMHSKMTGYIKSFDETKEDVFFG